MPLGDFISQEDYDQLYGKETRKSRAWSWLTVFCYVLCLILAAWITQGCDGEAAEATHESVVTAMEKKAELLGHPLYWTATVTQCDVKYGCKTRYYVPRKE